jgi:hypothetical protein
MVRHRRKRSSVASTDRNRGPDRHERSCQRLSLLQLAELAQRFRRSPAAPHAH